MNFNWWFCCFFFRSLRTSVFSYVTWYLSLLLKLFYIQYSIIFFIFQFWLLVCCIKKPQHRCFLWIFFHSGSTQSFSFLWKIIDETFLVLRNWRKKNENFHYWYSKIHERDIVMLKVVRNVEQKKWGLLDFIFSRLKF